MFQNDKSRMEVESMWNRGRDRGPGPCSRYRGETGSQGRAGDQGEAGDQG